VAGLNNEWTVPHLRAFLEDLSQRSRAKRIRIVAHSMGNRALCHALEQIALKGQPAHFQQVILMAPDVDRGVFTELAAAIRGAADKVTLYASSKDEALVASKAINGEPRAGDSFPQPATSSGIDTIDVSDVSTNFWNDVIGHFYYGQNDSVVSDLFSLLRDIDIRQSPRLQHLQAVEPSGYWKFVK
jgi:esterase/lipase superfamily enzyme